MGGSIYNFFAGHHDIDINNINGAVNKITGIMVLIGYVCAVIMILYIGVRYIVATPNQKAQLKTQLVYLVAGVCLLVSVTSIFGMVTGVFESVFG